MNRECKKEKPGGLISLQIALYMKHKKKKIGTVPMIKLQQMKRQGALTGLPWKFGAVPY